MVATPIMNSSAVETGGTIYFALPYGTWQQATTRSAMKNRTIQANEIKIGRQIDKKATTRPAFDFETTKCF